MANTLARKEYSVNLTVLPWLRIATGSVIMSAFACISFAPHGDVHRDQTVVALRVIERQRLVTDRPFARGEVPDRNQRAKRSQNGNSMFHVRPRRIGLIRGRMPRRLRSVLPKICPAQGHGKATAYGISSASACNCSR